MAELSEKSFPFDADEIDGEYDRVYYAEDWMRYFRAFISSGTFMKEPTNLQIIANGDMTVTLKKGAMIIDGARYDNENDIVITLDPADGVLSRIDRIAITWSKEDKDIHYEVRKGNYSYKPLPAECRRSAEYKDYAVADVMVRAGAIKIKQTDITDQRLNSNVCGLATPFAEIDTKGIFLQLQSFYDETVAKQQEWEAEQIEAITAYFEEIRDLLGKENELHEQHKKDIDKYFSELQERGNADLVTIIQQLINFRDTKEADILNWFEEVKGTLGTDPAGKLMNKINDLTGQMEGIEKMLLAGRITARLLTDDGKYLTDDMGNVLLIDSPICICK